MSKDKETAKQIKNMIVLLNKCINIYVKNADHRKAQECIRDIHYLEKKLKQVEARTRSVKEVTLNGPKRCK